MIAGVSTAQITLKSNQPALAPVEEMVSNERPINNLFSLTVRATRLREGRHRTVCSSQVPSLHRTLSTARLVPKPPPAKRSSGTERHHLGYVIV
jgi:hypothetical protein